MQNKLHISFAAVLGAILALFALQNLATIHVTFLGFEFQMPRIALILISVAVGFILGKAIKFRRH